MAWASCPWSAELLQRAKIVTVYPHIRIRPRQLPGDLEDNHGGTEENRRERSSKSIGGARNRSISMPVGEGEEQVIQDQPSIKMGFSNFFKSQGVVQSGCESRLLTGLNDLSPPIAPCLRGKRFLRESSSGTDRSIIDRILNTWLNYYVLANNRPKSYPGHPCLNTKIDSSVFLSPESFWLRVVPTPSSAMLRRYLSWRLFPS